MSLTLDENHIYRLNEVPLDGLTSTIYEAGLIHNGDPWYMERGTAVHIATELWDKGTLDEDTVDPQIKGYLESWKLFRKDQNYTPEAIEYMTYHPILLVATKIDRVPLLDLKTGSPEPWHILQVAFQNDCLKIMPGTKWNPKWTPMDVYLDPDGGSPKVKVYSPSEIREAFKVYCSMLHFLRWKRSANGHL